MAKNLFEVQILPLICLKLNIITFLFSFEIEWLPCSKTIHVHSALDRKLHLILKNDIS